MNNDLISREALKKAYFNAINETSIGEVSIIELIDNAPTVKPYCYFCGQREHGQTVERPQGEWIRKEDVIHSIVKQYSEHNELVPIWLSIGDMKGGTV